MSAFAFGPSVNPADQRAALVTNASGLVTWVFAVPFAAPPNVVGIVQSPPGSLETFNCQLDGPATTTQVTFRINRTNPVLVALIGLTISVQAAPGVQTIHARAEALVP